MKIAQQSVELLGSYGSDLTVVNAARVSFNKESNWEVVPGKEKFEKSSVKLLDQDIKLINYLANHNHWTPFAHTTLQFRIKAPIFVARQLVKHQVGGVWNEVSRRYVSDEPEFYFPDVWRGKPVNSKQGSSEVVIDVSEFHLEDSINFQLVYQYKNLLAKGVAPEQARMVLPQNTMTEWWWTGSIAFFARVCKLRLDPHAQKETQEIAQMISNAVPKEFEHSWKALTQ